MPSHCETAATKQSPRKLRRERIRKSRAPAGFASKPLQEYSLKNLETLLLEPLKTMKNNENVLLLEPLKTMKSCPSHCEVAFRTPKNNEIVPQPLRNCSHQAKPKKAASGAHPEKQSPSRFCVQAIAGVQPQKSRNVAFGTPKNNKKQSKRVAFGPPKNNEIVPQPLRNCSRQAKHKKAASGAHPKKQSRFRKSCPSHCETAATKQSPRKLRRERIRKSRAPAGFASKPLQEYSLKNLETLLLEPLKTIKNNENVLLLDPLKTMKSCPSHCETAATKQSTRKLRRERIRKSRAGFASKPLQEYSLKNLNENVLLLEPLKTMKCFQT